MIHGFRWLGFSSGLMIGTLGITSAAWAEQALFVAYPPDGHETTSAQIFLIGTAPIQDEVTVNGVAIDRSPAGHFAPSLPLQVGENLLTLKYQNQVVTLHIKRVADAIAAPVGAAFGADSLTPAVDVARLPSEPICFGAIAPPNASVSVTLSHQTIPLLPQSNTLELPPNSAVLTLQNQPAQASAQSYQGCITGETWYSTAYGNATGSALPSRSVRLNLGYPRFNLTLDGKTVMEQGKGKVEILSPAMLAVVEVTAESGTARTGASTDYSRLTPLPKGTRAAVTAQEGEWLQLDYGGWLKAAETQIIPNAVLPQTLIRSVRASRAGDWTEVAFPLQIPVPVSVQQGDRTFTLTLYNTTAQTDIIALDTDLAIARLDWQQSAPGQVQYTFQLKSEQQWGYKLRYEGTTLILSLRHPPHLTHQKPLSGVSVLLDPGHGGAEDLGSRGPTGYPEKDITLIMANLVRDRLIARGATVYMTREGDIDLYPNDRTNLINQIEPTIAISLHYNALPDSGDALNTRGVSAFWYNTQAHSLADSLHNKLVTTLDRPSYGIFWNNLALTRPTVAPAILLELGFMINPEEFEWIINPQEQEKLADAIAEGVTEWVEGD
jgi:N-acetylmuramoyl-L-alanine amidase